MMQFSKKQKTPFAKIAKKFALNLIVIFGSQIKNNVSSNSDVDIAVIPQNGLKLSSYPLLAHQLGSVLGNYNIDLTILKHAGPLLLGQIAKNCRLLYERKKGDFLSFRLAAMKRFADAEPLFKAQEKQLKLKIKEYEKELNK